MFSIGVDNSCLLAQSMNTLSLESQPGIRLSEMDERINEALKELKKYLTIWKPTNSLVQSFGTRAAIRSVAPAIGSNPTGILQYIKDYLDWRPCLNRSYEGLPALALENGILGLAERHLFAQPKRYYTVAVLIDHKGNWLIRDAETVNLWLAKHWLDPVARQPLQRVDYYVGTGNLEFSCVCSSSDGTIPETVVRQILVHSLRNSKEVQAARAEDLEIAINDVYSSPLTAVKQARLKYCLHVISLLLSDNKCDQAAIGALTTLHQNKARFMSGFHWSTVASKVRGEIERCFATLHALLEQALPE